MINEICVILGSKALVVVCSVVHTTVDMGTGLVCSQLHDLSMSLLLCTLEDHKGTKDLMFTSVSVSGWLSSLYCWQRLLAW